MAKRKSITGIKRKKPLPKPSPAKETSPATDTNDADDSANEDDDLLYEAGTGQLLYPKYNGLSQKPKKKPRVARPGSHTFGQYDYTRSQHVTQTELQPHVEHVSQKTIEHKWTVPDESAHAAIQQLVRGVQLPVLAHFSSEQAKQEAQEVLGSARTALFKRLPKTPFPPKTGADDFDYDSLVKSNRELQQRISDATDVVNSLTKELDDKRTAFEAEQKERDDLEEAARNLAADTADSHYLSPPDDASQIKDLPSQIGLVQSEVT